jgi:class 3 adenylate cyclase/tetratricopeptide (TPR) repeat protein
VSQPGAPDEMNASTDRQHLESAIAGLEAQRALLGDALVDAALEPLRERLAGLAAGPIDADSGQALRQVSVLFLDVVGSTALSRRLDPEDMHAVLDGMLARCTAIVQAHQGKVLQYAGDSLLAVFGAEASREDDAERAVHAGLALLAEGRTTRESVARRHGDADFNLRVGLHTGRVLLGGGVDAGHSVRGSAVHVAARMEQTAPPGALRISHDTYRHVRGVFDVEVQPPIEVKGVDEPMTTYLVLGAKPRAFRVATRGLEGVETRMIGRDAELEHLQEAFRRLFVEPRFQAIAVIADAGLGKSRLLYEFENWAEATPEPFVIFQARAQPQTQGQPYGLLRDLLAWRWQIADSDAEEVARLKVEQGVAASFGAQDGADAGRAEAHLLGHLIGVDFSASPHIEGIRDDGRQVRNRGFHAAAQLFRRAAASNRAPVVLLLDDLHHADDGSLEFLDYLAQVDSDVPLLVLAAARPALLERRRGVTSAGEQRITLAPLDRNASRALANELLKKLPDRRSALRELLTGGAEGNPFYMEELVKMFVDEGAIRTGDATWSVVADKLLAVQVPATLTGVLQSRLDTLTPAQKLALQQASIIGFEFWDQALAAIDPNAVAALPGLMQRELIVAHAHSRLDGAREFAFAHQLLHHVTYDSLLKRTRRDGHARVAAWWDAQSGVRAGDFLGAIALHFEKGGEPDRACETFARAAEHARDRYAHEAALDHVGHALALLDAAAPAERARHLALRWRLLDVRERTLDLRGDRAAQQADIDALEALADALDDAARRAEAAWRRSDFAMRTGDYRTQEVSAREALRLAQSAGDEPLALRATLRLAIAVSFRGDAAQGKVLALDGLAAARALGQRAIESLFLNTLSVIAGLQDDTMMSLEMDQQRLRLDRAIGNPRNEAISLGNLGSEWLSLGDFAQARVHLEEGLELTRSVGDRGGEATLLGNLSQLALRQGDDTLALAQARLAVQTAVAVRNPTGEAYALCCLGNAELALGRHAEAAAAFERARAVATEIDDGQRFDAIGGVARTALAAGDLPAATAAVEALLGHLARGQGFDGAEQPRHILLGCYRVLERIGDARAAGVLARAHAELQAKAAAISDPVLRASFIDNLHEHREIVQAWAQLHAAAPGQR